ncbi:hypothetical protein [Sinisalibacter aestuarii]|uniref:Uncharacterized protein n=1 Tax=Sinisalibacter aestuarii TaxID=2949426 RepID=A0ABQ5M065_9RHOB|nr:hypothetical protein [Sinisalibacter aestuarii]GKY89887.1 hypothetical protein STA1M1_37560 [Sinisalibacter aestuarii]
MALPDKVPALGLGLGLRIRHLRQIPAFLLARRFLRLAQAGLGLEIEDRGRRIAGARLLQKAVGNMGDGLRLTPLIPRSNLLVAVADGAERIARNPEIIDNLLLVQERRQRLHLAALVG